MANMLTISRILFSIPLCFLPLSSPYWALLYLLAGLSDGLDGFVARKTHTESVLGSQLDTVADFVFLLVVFLRLLSLLSLSGCLYLWIFLIALVKGGTHLFYYIKVHHMLARHSFLNKVSGVLLFVFPLVLPFVQKELVGIAILLCSITTVAAIEEVILVIGQIRCK